jgi:hypothetical protein
MSQCVRAAWLTNAVALTPAAMVIVAFDNRLQDVIESSRSRPHSCHGPTFDQRVRSVGSNCVAQTAEDGL